LKVERQLKNAFELYMLTSKDWKEKEDFELGAKEREPNILGKRLTETIEKKYYQKVNR
jgi:hypothetical protein